MVCSLCFALVECRGWLKGVGGKIVGVLNFVLLVVTYGVWPCSGDFQLHMLFMTLGANWEFF